jgi:hypothetical protein
VKKIAIAVAAAALIADLALLFSGYRVLLWERRVSVGEHIPVAGWGDVHGDQESLVCRYWTGRSVKPQVYWYAPNNIMGRDECPFLLRAEAA